MRSLRVVLLLSRKLLLATLKDELVDLTLLFAPDEVLMLLFVIRLATRLFSPIILHPPFGTEHPINSLDPLQVLLIAWRDRPIIVGLDSEAPRRYYLIGLRKYNLLF